MTPRSLRPFAARRLATAALIAIGLVAGAACGSAADESAGDTVPVSSQTTPATTGVPSGTDSAPSTTDAAPPATDDIPVVTIPSTDDIPTADSMPADTVAGTAPVGTTVAPDRSDRATVLAVEVATRVGIDSSVDQGIFRSVSIVDRLGTSDDTAQIDYPESSVLLTPGEKAAIEAVLPGVIVTWVDSPDGVIDQMIASTPAPSIVGLVMLAEPVLVGDRAEVTSGVVCGPLCGMGGTDVIERQANGTWIVTGQTGGAWIS